MPPTTPTPEYAAARVPAPPTTKIYSPAEIAEASRVAHDFDPEDVITTSMTEAMFLGPMADEPTRVWETLTEDQKDDALMGRR